MYTSSVLDGVNHIHVFSSSLLATLPPPWLLDPGLGLGLVEFGGALVSCCLAPPSS